MSPAPAALESIRQRTDYRIGHGINDAHDQECGANQGRRDTEHLIVEQDRGDTARGYGGFLQRTRSENELGPDRNLAPAMIVLAVVLRYVVFCGRVQLLLPTFELRLTFLDKRFGRILVVLGPCTMHVVRYLEIKTVVNIARC